MDEFPRATQALRISPRHFVLLTGLPRNTCRNSSSVSEASHSIDGAKSEPPSTPDWFLIFFLCPFASLPVDSAPRGRNCARLVTGALRFHGQTSWQISQPKTIRP